MKMSPYSPRRLFSRTAEARLFVLSQLPPRLEPSKITYLHVFFLSNVTCAGVGVGSMTSKYPALEEKKDIVRRHARL